MRPDRTSRFQSVRVGAIVLLAVLALFLTPFFVITAPPASASPSLHPQRGVAAIAERGTEPVAPHSSILAVPGRERAPNYDQDANGSSVAAEGGAAAGDAIPSEITGFTDHGLEQALSRDGGLGVSQSAMEDAVASPVDVVRQANGTFKFVGNNATVVLNSDGRVVTTWATNSAGWRNVP